MMRNDCTFVLEALFVVLVCYENSFCMCIRPEIATFSDIHSCLSTIRINCSVQSEDTEVIVDSDKEYAFIPMSQAFA